MQANSTANLLLCLEPGCNSKPVVKSLCKKHYATWRMSPENPLGISLCSVDECVLPATTKVLMCHKHWYRSKKYGDCNFVSLSRSPILPELPEVEWAYLAGIIDGEGNIGVYGWSRMYSGKKSNTRISTWRPKIQVANTDRRMIDWLAFRFGHPVKERLSANKKHKTSYTWVCQSAKMAQYIASKCMPYLIIKKEQAMVVLSFPVEVNHPKNSPLHQEIRDLRYDLYLRTKALNRRGPLVA